MGYLAFCFLVICTLGLTSCTIYTEKRSEALSQAVFATSDSITHARFDLASQYSTQAERLAFPPKQRIKINPVYTTAADSLSPDIKISSALDTVKDKFKLDTPVVAAHQNKDTLRLIIPDHLRHAKLLIENSTEWNELIKTKEFSTKLQEDHNNLQKLTSDVSVELQKQTEMNSKLIQDLNILQKKVAQKDLAILQRNIVIVSLLLTIGGGVYLRIKGIL